MQVFDIFKTAFLLNTSFHPKRFVMNFRITRISIFAFIFSYVAISCSNHYFEPTAITPASAYPSAIDRAVKAKRYFIMQSGINIYSVSSVDLDNSKQQMTVTLDKIDSSHLVYLKNPEIRRSKATEGEKPVRKEIRLYMKDSTSYTLDEPHTIPLAKVDKVELLD